MTNLKRQNSDGTSVKDENIFEVVGPVCESSDVFGSDYSLPRDLAENDILGIQLAGAYGRVMSSQYNLRPHPREYILPPNSSEFLESK